MIRQLSFCTKKLVDLLEKILNVTTIAGNKCFSEEALKLRASDHWVEVVSFIATYQRA